MSDGTDRFAVVTVVLGLWLIAIPFLLGGRAGLGAGFELWNYLGVGTAFVVLGAYHGWGDQFGLPGTTLAAVALAVPGLWMVGLPFYSHPFAAWWLPWHDVAIGLAVTWLAVRIAMDTVDLDEALSPSRS